MPDLVRAGAPVKERRPFWRKQMIVKCKDGFYYKNPRWYNKNLIVTAVLAVEFWYRGRKPVTVRTLLERAGTIGVHLGVPVWPDKAIKGEMTTQVFSGPVAAGMFVDAFHGEAWITGCPAVPMAWDGHFNIRPDDIEDEIIEDYSIAAIKARQL